MEKVDNKKLEAVQSGIYLREGDMPKGVTIERVRKVAEMLASGKSDTNCRKYILSEFKVKDERTVDTYMSSAYRLLMPTDWNEEKERLITKNIKTLETIVDKCLDKENYKVAREAIDTLNRTLGVYGQNGVAIRKDNTGNEEILISFE